MKFLDITIFQTISTILLKAYTLDITQQLSLLISTLLAFLSDAVYFRMIVLVLSSSTSALIHLSNTLKHQTIVIFGFLLTALKVLIQFTGFNLQTMQLLLMVKRAKISTCSIASTFDASGHKWSFELINVSPLELKNQQQDQSNTCPSF